MQLYRPQPPWPGQAQASPARKRVSFHVRILGLSGWNKNIAAAGAVDLELGGNICGFSQFSIVGPLEGPIGPFRGGISRDFFTNFRGWTAAGHREGQLGPG